MIQKKKLEGHLIITLVITHPMCDQAQQNWSNN